MSLSNHGLASGLFFFEHIAKTAGTSWSQDIARTGLLKHCGTSHLVGPGSVQTLNATLATAALTTSGLIGSGSRACNLLNREDVLATSLRVFAWAGRLEPQIILLLRQPVTHVRSMYSHCQSPTGFLRRQREAAGTFRPIGFAAWLRLFDGSSSNGSQGGGSGGGGGDGGGWRVGWPYCYYNPANYQSHLLAAPAGADANRDDIFAGGRLRIPAPSLTRLRDLVQRTAYFVGVTEHYAASLCLLKAKLRGFYYSAPSGGGGDALMTRRQREQAACSAEALRTMSRTDYGNQAGATSALMTEEVLARIEALTQVDQLAYAFALERLFREAEQAGASLWSRVR